MLDRAIEISPEASGAIVGTTHSPNPATVRFAGFRLESDGTLFRDEVLIHLPPKELAALRLLLQSAGQIVTLAQLKQALWGDTHVSVDSIPKCMSSLRAHLQPEECIQTVYKRGYRFVAEVQPDRPIHAAALPRLAIPPFTTEPGIPDHLGVVIAEEATTRLSKAPGRLVSVLARDSAFTLAARGFTAVQVGEALHADLVLAGSLRALTDHFRLRVEMIRVADGVQIWVEDLLVDREKVAGIENDLAARLDFRVKTLLMRPNLDRANAFHEPALHPRHAAHSFGWAGNHSVPSSAQEHPGELTGVYASAGTTPEPEVFANRNEAYELYLRGHHEWQSLERHRMQDGQQHLNRAIELDPTLFAARIDLANLSFAQAVYGVCAPGVAADQIHRTVQPLQEMRGAMPALAWTQFHFDRDLPAALHTLARCADLPHDPWVTRIRSMFALSRHRFSEATALLEAAMEIDPYAPWLQARLAWTLHLEGRREESVAQVEKAVRLVPDHEGTALYGAMILAFNGHTTRAIHLAEKLIRRKPYLDVAAVTQAYALACAGRTAEAWAILERIEWMRRERFVMNSFTPAVLLELGEVDAALAGLHASNQSRCPWFFQILCDPRLNRLHGNPAFEQLRFILPQMEIAAANDPRLP